jgi:hypothetical protein
MGSFHGLGGVGAGAFSRRLFREGAMAWPCDVARFDV